MKGKVDLKQKKTEILSSFVPSSLSFPLVKPNLLAVFDVDFLAALVLYDSEPYADLIVICLMQRQLFKPYVDFLPFSLSMLFSSGDIYASISCKYYTAGYLLITWGLVIQVIAKIYLSRIFSQPILKFL